MRSGFRVLLVACCFVGAMASAALASAQARVTGTVVDDVGKAIKAATVTAESANLGQSFSATTDDKGHFTMIGLRPGQWRIVASAPGYLPEAGEVQLRSGNGNPPITIGIRRTASVMGPLGSVSARDLQTDLATADALFNQKRWDEAITAYRAILSKTPSLSAINLQIASAYAGKGDYNAAIGVYRGLLRIDPDSERALIGLATVSAATGDVAAAEATLTQAVQSPTAGRGAFYSLGDLKFEKGDTAEAAKWYQRAVTADPSWGKPLYKLGLVAIKQGDKTAAADYMTRAIAIDPVSPEADLARTAIDQLNK